MTRELLARSGLALATVSLYGFLFNRESGLSHSLGYNLQAAERILLGEVPYRDFHTLYPPATIYLNAAIFRAAGVGLYQALMLVFVFKALTVFALYLSARQTMPRLWALAAAGAGLFWLRPNGPFKAVPMHYGAFFLALGIYLLLRGLNAGAGGPLWLAGLSLSALALFKHNIGFYALAGALLVVWLREDRESERPLSIGKRGAGLRILAGFSLPLLVVGALFQTVGAFAPMVKVLLFGPGEFLVNRFGALPSPIVPLLVAAWLAITLHSALQAGSRPWLADSLAVAAIVLPALLLIWGDPSWIDPVLFWAPALLMGFCLASFWRRRELREGSPSDRGGGEILLFGALASFLEIFPRFAREQAVAAMPFVTILLFWLIHERGRRGRVRPRAGRQSRIALAALPLLFLAMSSRLFVETFFDGQLRLKSDTPLAAARGDGVLYPAADAAEIDRVAAYLEEQVAPDGYFFAHSRDATSLLFLTGRRNPSPVQFWDGVGVTEGDREATLKALDRRQVGLILTTPNSLRDETYAPLRAYLDRHFQPDAQFGEILALKRK